MNASESLSKIAPALAKAQAQFRAVAKSGENKFDHYKYANLEDYVSAIRPVLEAQGLSVLSSVEEVIALEDRATRAGGTEHAVRCKLVVRIIHESGEWIEAAAWGEGQDRADKATYKAITGARKYGLAAALGLATSDDPEADEGVGATGKPAQRQSPPPNSAKGESAAILRSFAAALDCAKDLESLKGIGAEITDDIKGKMTDADLKKLRAAYDIVSKRLTPPKGNKAA